MSALFFVRSAYRSHVGSVLWQIHLYSCTNSVQTVRCMREFMSSIFRVAPFGYTFFVSFILMLLNGLLEVVYTISRRTDALEMKEAGGWPYEFRVRSYVVAFLTNGRTQYIYMYDM